MACEMVGKPVARVESIYHTVKRMEEMLNKSEQLKDKLQLFLESPDSMDLTDKDRVFLTSLIKD